QRSRQRAWADLSPPRQEDDVDGGGEHEWKSRSGTSGWGLARGSSSWAHGRTHGGHCSAESASRPVGLCLVRRLGPHRRLRGGGASLPAARGAGALEPERAVDMDTCSAAGGGARTCAHGHCLPESQKSDPPGRGHGHTPASGLCPSKLEQGPTSLLRLVDDGPGGEPGRCATA
ncbi:unnamed protein product, partial [Prorocentrum cordatum]